MPKTLSALAFAVMVVGLVGLYYQHALFGREPIAIAVQVAAVLLMIAARLTFGGRSFHATANPTEGGVVQRGPYAYVRHPIYAAAMYIAWAGERLLPLKEECREKSGRNYRSDLAIEVRSISRKLRFYDKFLSSSSSQMSSGRRRRRRRNKIQV